MDFVSDNWSAATPEVAEALGRANLGAMPAYGDDPLTAGVVRQLCEVFEREVRVYLVPSGTAANLLCLQALTRPGGLVICSEQAHLHADEYNGPEFSTGMKLVPISTADARLTPASLDAGMAVLLPASERGPIAGLSLTNATERGTVYSAAEVEELAAIAHANGAAVHVDGARFANAVAATGESPADLTWRAGVDLMSFGGTKNGCWAAEAVIVFDPAAYPDLAILRQRAGHGLSKQRFIAAQYDGYLRDGAWLRTASHANAMADRLREGLARVQAVRLEWRSAANEVFPVMPAATAARLRAGGARFYTWEERGEEVVARLVTSFATTEQDVDDFLALIAEPPDC